MMRLLNILVICALVLAAASVYKIKFDSTLQAARVAKLGNELRHERDAIAALRAEWAKLDTPSRIQQLADHFLKLQPIDPHQFGTFDNLPARPPVAPPSSDPIGAMIAPSAPAGSPPMTTGSVPAAPAKR
jgi:cell division protein FtsL